MIKGVGRIYQQTFIDTYSKLAFVKLYDRKNAITAADMLRGGFGCLDRISGSLSVELRVVR